MVFMRRGLINRFVGEHLPRFPGVVSHLMSIPSVDDHLPHFPGPRVFALLRPCGGEAR